MKIARDSHTTEPNLGNVLAANGDRPRFPGGGKSWSVSHLPRRIDNKLDSVAADDAGAARRVAAIHIEDSGDAMKWRGEYGRIRMFQDRLDEAERLLSAIHRASKFRSPGYAKLVVNYANALHRLHRDDEAISVLDSIEPVLRKYPDTLDDQVAVAAKLRKAIVADH